MKKCDTKVRNTNRESHEVEGNSVVKSINQGIQLGEMVKV